MLKTDAKAESNQNLIRVPVMGFQSFQWMIPAKFQYCAGSGLGPRQSG